MQALDNNIYLYYTKLEQVNTDNLIYYKSLLSDEELSRLTKIIHPATEIQYLVSHGELRIRLAKHLNLEAKEVVIMKDQFGKPHFANCFQDIINFSISHTEGMVVCAIHKSKRIGVDVEFCKSLSDLEQLSEQVLSKSELKIFSKLDYKLKIEKFYEHWVLKEALAKGLGFGLKLPFHKINITDLKGQNADCSYKLEDNLINSKWCGRLLSFGEYKLGVAIESDSWIEENLVISKDVSNDQFIHHSCKLIKNI
jgi:4'-phosphopantetheinyl transferase